MWIFVVNIYVLLKIGGPRRDVCLGMVRRYGSGVWFGYGSEVSFGGMGGHHLWPGLPAPSAYQKLKFGCFA